MRLNPQKSTPNAITCRFAKYARLEGVAQPAKQTTTKGRPAKGMVRVAALPNDLAEAISGVADEVVTGAAAALGHLMQGGPFYPSSDGLGVPAAGDEARPLRRLLG